MRLGLRLSKQDPPANAGCIGVQWGVCVYIYISWKPVCYSGCFPGCNVYGVQGNEKNMESTSL